MYKVRFGDICGPSIHSGMLDLDDVATYVKPNWRNYDNRPYLVKFTDRITWTLSWALPLKPSFHDCRSIEEVKIKCDMLGIKPLCSSLEFRLKTKK